MSREYDKFILNIERVNGLVDLYDKLNDEKIKASGDNKLTDILRSSVVLLHSSFEDYFRNILIRWIPEKANENYIKNIPLALDSELIYKKITLNEIARCEEMTATEIVNKSITLYMRLKSFNSVSAIMKECKEIGINTSIFEDADKKNVDKCVKRRHKIVHEADRDNNRKLKTIKKSTLINWIEAYKNIVDNIEEEIKSWEKTCQD